jgi:HK97 family phage portal protein
MPVFDGLIDKITGVPELDDPWFWRSTWFGRQTSTGQFITPNNALSLPTYYACLRAISEDIGKLPLVIYRRRNERGKDEAFDHPLHDLLKRSPNEYMDSMSFRETLTHWAMGWGNGYAEIERSLSGQVLALHPIHPSRVKVDRLPDGGLIYRVRLGDGSESVLDQEDVLHVRGLGEGAGGWSIAAMAAESIGVSLAAQTFAGAFFGNGANVGGVLEHPGKLSAEARAILQKHVESEHAGVTKAHRFLLLQEGMKFNRSAIPPNEAQFIESRQFGVEDICRWFRVPPHKVQHLLRATNANAEQMAIEYVTDTLMAWMVRWEQSLERKLLLGDERSEMTIRHVVLGLLRGDSKNRSEYYRRRFSIGTLSPNDIRELEDENPIENGDGYFVPVNLVNVDRADEVQSPAGGADQRGGPEESVADGGNRDDAADLREAMLPIFADAADRWVRKEIKALTNAAKRCGCDGDLASFGAWAGEFYAGQEEFFSICFAPAALSCGLLAVVDRGRDMAGLVAGLGREATRRFRDTVMVAAGSGRIREHLDHLDRVAVGQLTAEVLGRVVRMSTECPENVHRMS